MEDTGYSVLDAIGNTPLVRIKNVYAKLESVNPSGSIKDRVALEIIEAAERSGELKRGYTIVEASSGNTGISLSMVAMAKGYHMVVVMPENMSEERKQMMLAYGAQTVLTLQKRKPEGGYRASGGDRHEDEALHSPAVQQPEQYKSAGEDR